MKAFCHFFVLEWVYYRFINKLLYIHINNHTHAQLKNQIYQFENIYFHLKHILINDPWKIFYPIKEKKKM